eukprot:TRINITY_DN622_c0_g1_i3.p2 TRINITY_DN622_c0_g1~~TRINITY_DN622_c0_g1_i3.p2  ORF type:complete len:154 (+),score=40.57 TRINITY_DN622_c0_g1_i3:102-563(+)
MHLVQVWCPPKSVLDPRTSTPPSPPVMPTPDVPGASVCTWCKCGALPSQCWTLDDAKKLPAGVYVCDKQEELSQLPAIKVEDGDACGNKYTTQSTCDADSGCTWCKCGALPSQCWTLDDAKKLPAGVYVCDKHGVYVCDKQEELSGVYVCDKQ